MELFITIVLGAVAGYFGPEIFSNRGYLFTGNMVIGIVGSCTGYWLSGIVNHPLDYGITSIFAGAAGAVILIELFSMIIKQVLKGLNYSQKKTALVYRNFVAEIFVVS